MHHLTKRDQGAARGLRPTRATGRSRTSPGTTPSTATHAEPSAEAVLREINGYDVATGAPLPGFAELARRRLDRVRLLDLLAASTPTASTRRGGATGRLAAEGGSISPEWGWAWPANRRILYNRASADPTGKPWSERKKLVWWDEDEGEWIGPDVPDFPVDKRPDYRGADDAEGMDAIGGDDPFMMMADGRAWLFAPSGLVDGPLPTHYEPLESPLDEPALPRDPRQPGGAALDAPGQPVRRARATRATRAC